MKTKFDKELTLQNITVGDAKASCRLTVWEDQVGTLHEGKTYKIKDLKVKEYNCHKSLSASADTVFEETADLGEVEEDLSDEEESTFYDVLVGEIEVVLAVEEYERCKTCKSKVSHISDTIVECTKCHSLMKVSKCAQAVTAKVIIGDNEDKVVTMFSNIISEVTDGVEGPSIAQKLLLAPKRSYSIGKNNIVYHTNQV